MSRTDKYRLGYFLLAGLLIAVAALIVFYRGIDAGVVFFALLLAAKILAAQIQRHYWHDHFMGRQLFKMRRWQESVHSSLQFIDLAQSKPWLSRLVWLHYQVTSRDIIAITQNNVASAYMAFGDYSHANAYLDEALRRDSLYPVPHLNRSKILLMQKCDEQAREELAECRRLGFRLHTWESLCKEVLPYRDGTKTM